MALPIEQTLWMPCVPNENVKQLCFFVYCGHAISYCHCYDNWMAFMFQPHCNAMNASVPTFDIDVECLFTLKHGLYRARSQNAGNLYQWHLGLVLLISVIKAWKVQIQINPGIMSSATFMASQKNGKCVVSATFMWHKKLLFQQHRQARAIDPVARRQMSLIQLSALHVPMEYDNWLQWNVHVWHFPTV